MYQLIQAIPDHKLLLSLEPEELGAKLLFLARKRFGPDATFFPSNLLMELWSQSSIPTGQNYYPLSERTFITRAWAEAWAWMEAQGLIVPTGDSSGQRGSRMLSRRAQKIESEADFTSFKVGRLLPKEMLHSKIDDVVWAAFMRAEFDGAAFHAMKGVEVSVRFASGLGNDLIGVKLMRKAFAPEDGPLTDMATETGERQGRADLFAGAIASYKNPHSHRDVNLDDPYEALEIIYLANHLLRIVDARAKARKEQQR